MKPTKSVLPPEIMNHFPSGTGLPTFSQWVANLVALEQLIGVAGLLAPAFYEVGNYVFWDEAVAKSLDGKSASTPFGDDPESVERYYNVLNLEEFFLSSADSSLADEELVLAFGHVLQHFWGLALRVAFPERTFMFDVLRDPFDEDGICLTFSQHGSARVK